MDIVWLCEEAINPVQYVQCSVCPAAYKTKVVNRNPIVNRWIKWSEYAEY